jgi:hypothetical protein
MNHLFQKLLSWGGGTQIDRLVKHFPDITSEFCAIAILVNFVKENND